MNARVSQDSPTTALAVTPSDTVENKFSLLYVGVTGNVKVTTRDGNDVTFTAVPAGQYVFVQTNLVWATGTTATSIVGIA